MKISFFKPGASPPKLDPSSSGRGPSMMNRISSSPGVQYSGSGSAGGSHSGESTATFTSYSRPSSPGIGGKTNIPGVPPARTPTPRTAPEVRNASGAPSMPKGRKRTEISDGAGSHPWTKRVATGESASTLVGVGVKVGVGGRVAGVVGG